MPRMPWLIQRLRSLESENERLRGELEKVCRENKELHEVAAILGDATKALARYERQRAV